MTPRKILCIDKDDASRRFVASLLRQHGHAVETAASGMEGPQASAGDGPDLILVGSVPDVFPGDPSA